jgi:hypothetical protein
MTGRNDLTVLARCRMVACLTLLCLVISLAACLGTDPAPEKLVTERCTKCHTLAPIQVSHKTYHEWETTVYRMMGHGAHLNDREAKAVIDYLSQTYGPVRR